VIAVRDMVPIMTWGVIAKSALVVICGHRTLFESPNEVKGN